MKFAQGNTRNVFLIWWFAIKIARDKNGRRCNIVEFYKTHQLGIYSKILIAPVWLCLFQGWVIVQPRCKEAHYDVLLITKEGLELVDTNNDIGLHAENHYSNVGYLKGKLVYFDYA